MNVSDLIRPDTLVEGQIYLLVDDRDNGYQHSPILVTFQAYTACPPFVIITDGASERIRCLRECLFLTTDDCKGSTTMAEKPLPQGMRI